MWGSLKGIGSVFAMDAEHNNLQRKMDSLMVDMRNNQSNLEKFEGTSLEGYFEARRAKLEQRLFGLMGAVEKHNDGPHKHPGNVSGRGYADIMANAEVLRGYNKEDKHSHHHNGWA